MNKRIESFINSICWTTYCRSFIFTLGFVFIAISTLASFNEFEIFKELSLLPLVIFTTIAIFGASLITISFLANDERVEQWANDAGSGGLGVIIIMAIAIPVYFLAMLIKTIKTNSK